MRFSLKQKFFGRKNQPASRRQPARFRPRLEYLETRELLNGATFIVNSTATGFQDGSAAHPFATIQQGVNAADMNGGDTVQVDAGTYHELVQVDRPVTLLGAQSGVDARTRSSVPESIVSNANGDFQVLADNVIINGFTLEGVTNDSSIIPASLGAAIWTNPGFLNTHGGLQAINNIIQGNIAGIELDNDGTFQTKIQDNLFQNNNQPGPNSGLDIETDFGLSNALIDSNKFTNTSFVTNSYALGTEAPSANITFSNNTVTNHGRGVFLYDTSNVTVTNNTFTGTTHYAIGAFGGDNGLNIQHNTIQNGGTALLVEDDLGSPGTPQPNSNIQANCNNIVGNTQNVVISTNGSSPDGYTGTLDATNNWWGSPNGPAPGTIVGNVNYTPWLLAPSGNSFILLLDKTGKDSLSVTSTAQVNDNGGAIVVDSNSSEAALAAQNGQVNASTLFVTGTAVKRDSATLPANIVQEAPTPDPLASLPPVSQPATTFTNVTIGGNAVVTLQPGTYVGGITISGNAIVTLAPGIYYLKNGGFNVSGFATVVTGSGYSPDTGSGVLIYQSKAYNLFGAPIGGISVSGQASVNLTAPTLGAYQGIAIFEDRTFTAPISVSNKGQLTVHGTIYAASAAVKVIDGKLTLVSDSSSDPDNLIVADLQAGRTGVVTVGPSTSNC